MLAGILDPDFYPKPKRKKARNQVYKNKDGSLVVLLKRKVRCPWCKKLHKWPTEDKLCRKCEGEWTAGN